jgi:hypothetical protein
MAEHKHEDHTHRDTGREGHPAGHNTDSSLGPYWKRAHRDWRFWAGVVFMAAAIIIYVMTVDLSMVGHRQP